MIVVDGFSFFPQNLSVPAGATIVVDNLDDFDHSVTSSSAPGSYVFGAVGGVSFDTGIFPSGETRAFSIPTGTPVGTVIPYFCRLFTSAMHDQGQVTIVASDAGAP